jgi:hypothetical protein
MDLMEITEKERLSREDAAAHLHALADALARHTRVEFERRGLRFKCMCPTRSTSSSRSRSARTSGSWGSSSRGDQDRCHPTLNPGRRR